MPVVALYSINSIDNFRVANNFTIDVRKDDFQPQNGFIRESELRPGLISDSQILTHKETMPNQEAYSSGDIFLMIISIRYGLDLSSFKPGGYSVITSDTLP
jgi:hypothetical protein